MGYAIPALLVQNGRMHGERQSDIRIAQQRPLSHRTKVAEVRNTGFTITEADFKPVTRLARQGARRCRLTAFKIQRTKYLITQTQLTKYRLARRFLQATGFNCLALFCINTFNHAGGL